VKARFRTRQRKPQKSSTIPRELGGSINNERRTSTAHHSRTWVRGKGGLDKQGKVNFVPRREKDKSEEQFWNCGRSRRGKGDKRTVEQHPPDLYFQRSGRNWLGRNLKNYRHALNGKKKERKTGGNKDRQKSSSRENDTLPLEEEISKKNESQVSKDEPLK